LLNLPPPCPTPVGCNKNVAEVYFTITDQDLLDSYNIANVTINTYNCGYLNLPVIPIPYTYLNPNQNPLKIGPLYLKFCDYTIYGRYTKKNGDQGAKFIQNTIVKIDKCNMEIPIDKNLNDC